MSAFRPSRFFRDDQGWYFYTRELDAPTGPFRRRSDAESAVDLHIERVTSRESRAASSNPWDYAGVVTLSEKL